MPICRSKGKETSGPLSKKRRAEDHETRTPGKSTSQEPEPSTLKTGRKGGGAVITLEEDLNSQKLRPILNFFPAKLHKKPASNEIGMGVGLSQQAPSRLNDWNEIRKGGQQVNPGSDNQPEDISRGGKVGSAVLTLTEKCLHTKLANPENPEEDPGDPLNNRQTRG